jgi:hypothetical protein
MRLLQERAMRATGVHRNRRKVARMARSYKERSVRKSPVTAMAPAACTSKPRW